MSEKATLTAKNKTGSGKLKMATTKPELPVSQHPDMIETKFQPTANPTFSGSSVRMSDETRSWKSTMTDAKQEVSLTRLPDLLDTTFQGHTRIFRARYVREGIADTEK